MAELTVDQTTYNYCANDPVYWNDPTGLSKSAQPCLQSRPIPVIPSYVPPDLTPGVPPLNTEGASFLPINPLEGGGSSDDGSGGFSSFSYLQFTYGGGGFGLGAGYGGGGGGGQPVGGRAAYKDWEPFTGAVLERFIRHVYHLSDKEMSGGTWQNEAGGMFERTFNSWAQLNLGVDYQPNRNKYCDDLDENCTIPDGISTFFHEGRISFPNLCWWEVTKTKDIMPSSKKNLQLRKMMSNLSQRSPENGIGTLNLVTIYDSNVSGWLKIKSLFDGITFRHLVPLYKVYNSTLFLQFGYTLPNGDWYPMDGINGTPFSPAKVIPFNFRRQ